MRVKIRRQVISGEPFPLSQGSCAMLLVLVREYYVARGGFHQLDRRAELYIEADAGGWIYLGQDGHLSAFNNAHVTRLLRLMSKVMHDGKRFGDEPLRGRMLLHQPEELECQRVSLALHLGDIAAALQALKRTKSHRDGSPRFPRDPTFGEAARLMREQLDDIETLFERGRRIGVFFLRIALEQFHILLSWHNWDCEMDTRLASANVRIVRLCVGACVGRAMCLVRRPVRMPGEEAVHDSDLEGDK